MVNYESIYIKKQFSGAVVWVLPFNVPTYYHFHGTLNYSALLYRQETTANASPDYAAWADVKVTCQNAGARLCDDTERTTRLAAPGATTTASSCGRARSAAKGLLSSPG